MHFKISAEIFTCKGDRNPLRYISVYRAWIFEHDDSKKELAIGSMTFTLVDVESALLDRQPIYDIFLTDSDLMGYFSRLYKQLDERATFKFHFRQFAGGNRNLLILNSLEMRPAFRRQKLGLIATVEIVRQFRSSVGVIAMVPAPLEIVESVPNIGSQVEGPSRKELRLRKQVTAKLKKYFSLVGFHSLSGTDLMVRGSQEPLPFSETLQEDRGHPRALGQ
jgi:hypothetical protein